MDWLQFLASLAGSLAWPATVVVAVVVLRNQLRRVLLTLTRLRYKDLELDFGRELKEVEKKARAIDVKPAGPPRAIAAPKDSAQTLDEAERLAEDFPEPAVALAWSAVEDELLGAVMRLAILPDYPPYNSALRNARLLLDQRAIDENTLDILDRLRNLRNMAVHGGAGLAGVSPDEAREFIALARGVVEKLRRLRRD
jgi:uncharacterized protein YutE (UPF0331/DUF86 family)